MASARLDWRLPARPVGRESVQDRVYRQLVAMILDGEIEPGRTVTITGIADAFQVSAMPVREALHRLTAAKALTVVAGRSVGIPPLTVERLSDLRRVRVEVEGLAAEWAAANIVPSTLARLDELIATMSSHLGQEDRKHFLPVNREFHFAVYRTAGSEALLALIESLWLQIGPYLNLLRGSGNWRTANQQHQALRDALDKRDGRGARAAVRADIEEAAAILGRLLQG
ncbi:MAG TPA: GntR family transcriptional regulator [Geminicoccus sp.]|jgi:DNA-binding GntR family transcriptional regulator|uniref:GntR family transcriptional regulator n=1 Tax=Geminicoccus sp. TaxID=2024832 RepID=UPI002E365C09|nr:GntR family transcriptional regulator [Geminicoccus sp.]HEX2525418.1 GntR family transcriptional regulator [Geminicoccus sp.]